MSIEGAVGMIAGVTAGSIALMGWALSSGVEGLASIIVIWRGSRGHEPIRSLPKPEPRRRWR
jgi:hypothetical protein